VSTTSNTITTRVFDYSTSLRPDKYNEARSTIAGYFNSDGVWTIAPANVPRIDYDPSTVRGNYCISSSDLTKVYPIFGDDGSAWFPGADITVTRDGTLAPDGSLAVKIERVIGEVEPPEIFQFINAPANSTQLISVYAKAGSHSMVFLNLENNASPNENATASFDISGTDPIIFPQQQATQGGGRILDAYGVYQGNGWYRLILCGNVDTADNGFYIVFGMTPKTAYNLNSFGEPFWNDETNTPAYAYFANPQTEVNTVTVGDYIATTTAPAFSSAQPRGLLVEPTHTNLYVNSSDLNDATAWTYNSTQLTNDGSIAPDGSLAFVLTATTNTDYNNVLYNLDPITITPNTNYGLSVYAHADTANYLHINIQEWFTTNSFAGAVFDLTGHANGTPTQTYVGSTSGQIISAVSEYVGDGWFRCSLVANINDVGAAATIGMSDSPTPALIDVFGNIQPIGFQKSIRLAMPQFEQGNTVTSYIKTKGGALTRTADDITFALNDIETSSLVFTFDDNTTQTLSAKGATIYSIPTNLQRPWIRYIDVQVLHKTTSILEDYNSILPFIEKQFPEFYQDQGPIFIEFVKAYYDWLSQTDGLLDKIRNFEKYHDVDTTLDEFLTHFTNAYLYGVPSSILGDKRFLIKHVLDVYRSKGTIQGYKLLFRLLYDEDIDVYLPQKDMLLLSDGTWYAPKYLEVSDNPLNATFIGKRIKGSASGAEAIVQDYIVQFVGKAVCVLYLSNITGEFQQGEKILAIQDFDTIAVLDAPTVLGSLTSLAIISGGQNFNVGDILVPTNGTGREVQYRVSGTANGTGTLLYNIVDGGSMYSTSANTYLTRTTNSGHGSSFDIGGVSSVQTLQFNKDIIIALANTLINNPNYHFMGMDNANAATQIGNAFTYDSRLFGTIEHLTNILTGNSYTSPPNVTVKDVIYTGNLVGNVFWSNSSANVVGVGTDFTYYFHAGDYIEFQITHESNPFVEHRIISSVTNSTFLTLDDYPATYGDGGFEAISISAGGTGYANGAYITFTDSLGTGANAQIFTNTSGGITSIILNNRGSHYLSPTLTAPVGTGATLAGLIDYGNFSLGVPLISSQFSQSFLANTILNSEDGNNAIITATPQFGVGIIANVEVRSSGFGYHDDELLEFGALGALKDITINLGGTLYQNNDPLIFSGGAPVNEAVGSVLTDANGTITTLNIVYAGSGYQTVPTIRVRTIGGSGANISANVGGLDHTFLVSGYGVKTGVGRQQGFWTSTRGFLDSDKYIQDSFYYQDMSYEIRAPKTLELYADILKQGYSSCRI
jgi:hypothetical protein